MQKDQEILRKPPWLKVRLGGGPNYQMVRGLVERYHLHTVCQSACCPNIGECWDRGTATFMILGDVCTRNCGFCAVPRGRPSALDEKEPERVAQAVAQLGLRYAVITSVTRDDLPDGGASIFAQTVLWIRRLAPGCQVELLIPDLGGAGDALEVVVAGKPDVLAHNLETVCRLYDIVRPQADYSRSLELLKRAKEQGVVTKSGLMLGLGETLMEVHEAMADLAARQVDILTLGQYLRPSKVHLPVARYLPPEEFAQLKVQGEALGFKAVEAGPLVRSSYHAEESFEWKVRSSQGPQLDTLNS